MTLTELQESKIGTTDVFVEENKFAKTPDMQYRVVHREKIQTGIRSVNFYGETPKIAIDKLLASNRKIQL